MESWIGGCFILASGLILFSNLWTRSLENHDYLRYAEVAREMIRSGEWIVPHLNGEIYIDKPPLTLWLIALPSFLYGAVTPFLARLPSALSAWVGIGVLFLWARRVYGSTPAGLIAGGVLLSSYQYFFEARMAKTDMVLCLFILLSLYFFYFSDEGSRRRRFFYVGLSFFFMGLGVLTKGPFGFFLPMFIIAAFLVKERRFHLLISGEFIIGYLVLAMTVLPWVFLFVHRVGLDQSLVLVKGSRILSRHAPIYFYFIKIWTEFFPCSLLLPFLALSLWKERERIWDSKESFFILWFFVIFVLLTLFKFRASRYLLPALPPLALLMGGVWRMRRWTFLVPILLFVLIWHAVEAHWVRTDLPHSPGRMLTDELRPFLKEAALFGFRLDVGTVEEINFYFDRVIPLMKKAENLFTPTGENRLILMPKKVYEALRAQGDPSIIFVRGFRYKGEELILVSPKPSHLSTLSDPVPEGRRQSSLEKNAGVV